MAGDRRDTAAIEWLLESDASIRWQALRDLTTAAEADWRAERAKVETEGWGARLLALRDDDGQWAGGAFAPADFDWSTIPDVGQPWTATGARPDPRLEPAIELVRSKRHADVTWHLDRRLRGRVWFDVDDGPGRPSRWLTLRALRVLRWWDGEPPCGEFPASDP